MSKLNTNVLAAVITIIVFFFLGRLLFLASAQGELEQLKDSLQFTNRILQERNAELEILKKTVQADTDINRSKTVLKPGEESSILHFILSNAGNSFKLNTFELLTPYFIKSGAETDSGSQGQFSATLETLPDLDDQGMPINMAAESDEDWPGVEIVPIRITFATTYSGLGSLLSKAVKYLPMHAVRSMDLRLSRTVKGTLIMTLPVAEKSKN